MPKVKLFRLLILRTMSRIEWRYRRFCLSNQCDRTHFSTALKLSLQLFAITRKKHTLFCNSVGIWCCIAWNAVENPQSRRWWTHMCEPVNSILPFVIKKKRAKFVSWLREIAFSIETSMNLHAFWMRKQLAKIGERVRSALFSKWTVEINSINQRIEEKKQRPYMLSKSHYFMLVCCFNSHFYYRHLFWWCSSCV